MSRFAFLSFILALTVGFVQIYWHAKDQYSPVDSYQVEIKKLKEQVEREQLAFVTQAEAQREFRQDVAALMPEVLRGVTEKAIDYPRRNLASVVTSGRSDKLQEMMASTLFESGKSLFRSGDYERANKLFAKVIDRYGYVKQSIEAHFLMIEGQYQLGDLEGVSRSVAKMVELFPESELTGFALLRLGQVFEHKERYAEAVDLYRTVLRSFPYRSVASQAERNLRDMEP